jgi:hypothetical protein
MRYLVAVLLVATLGCHKGNPETCDKVCRNYAELVYWEKANAEIAAAPAEKRDELRQQKLAEFTKNLELGINTCTSKCISADNDDTNKCVLAAKTAQQARACADTN